MGDAFGEFLDVKINVAVITRNRLIDFGLDIGFQSLVVQERFWMNPDRVVDDEFQPCEADTCVGETLKIKRPLRIADIHADLEWQLGHICKIDPLDFKIYLALVDPARVSLRT